ncbi:hypothetical protein STRDD11_02641 [Streptococcus sp. DD11]|uniref:kinase n=1 Tax=Streptococcus sp. DD11 TaxID=1777879 RepID=UPI000791D6B2|nr:kinase [Streptococcus sp. DD11]KXT77391.1 hypothetical protein STRDD11_02641 [Streptococcus sp. DD11]
MARLVIIRGNSGSGKTTLGLRLQEHFGRCTLLISQDTVRRDMLKEKVEPGNLSIDLAETLARFAYEHDLLVLVEGFYETDIYGQMLEQLKKLFAPHVFAYYYDLSFEETVRRHRTRAKQQEFSPDDMRRWWQERDFLGWEAAFFRDGDSLEAAFDRIVRDLKGAEKG